MLNVWTPAEIRLKRTAHNGEVADVIRPSFVTYCQWKGHLGSAFAFCESVGTLLVIRWSEFELSTSTARVSSSFFIHGWQMATFVANETYLHFCWPLSKTESSGVFVLCAYFRRFLTGVETFTPLEQAYIFSCLLCYVAYVIGFDTRLFHAQISWYRVGNTADETFVK